MKKLLLGMLVMVLMAFAASAAEFEAGNLQVKSNFPADVATVLAPNVITPEYSNIVSYSGQVFLNGGSTQQGANTITRLVADDLTPAGVNGGLDVTSITFSVANLNGVAVTVRPRIRFWFADGAGGGPGTYYNLPASVGFSFNPITIAPGVTLLTGTLGPAQMSMPSTTFWAGLTFDNLSGSTGATAAQLDLMGQGLFDPPTVGSSADQAFLTTAAGSFFAIANPAGSSFNFGAPTVANFGWEFNVDALTPAVPSTWGRLKSLYR